MKIAVLNGSPKGMTSVTMQYVLFLKKVLPGHKFAIHDVCHDLKRLESDEHAFDDIVKAISEADLVLWAFPVYYMLVHAYYKRFIELLFERGAKPALRGKYAASLSTSIRFFDHTAHQYIAAISEDLGMRFIGSYSAEMDDLFESTERDRLKMYFEEILRTVAEEAPTPRRFPPAVSSPFDYEPGRPIKQVETRGKSIVILVDEESSKSNIARMTARLRESFQGPATLINLREIRIRGGCVGCLQCCLDNVCVYRDADDVYETYRALMAADLVVLAGSIHDRYLSSRWKLFFDRGFFNNHVPIFGGKHVAYMVSGPLGQVANLRQVLEAYFECQQASLVGIVTDECEDSDELDRLVDTLADRLISSAAAGYVRPPTFLGESGNRLFRDEIWADLRMVFQADHRYYKAHGLYDFPHRTLATRVRQGMMMLLTKIPSFRREFKKRMKDEMIKPYQRVLQQLGDPAR